MAVLAAVFDRQTSDLGDMWQQTCFLLLQCSLCHELLWMLSRTNCKASESKAKPFLFLLVETVSGWVRKFASHRAYIPTGRCLDLISLVAPKNKIFLSEIQTYVIRFSSVPNYTFRSLKFHCGMCSNYYLNIEILNNPIVHPQHWSLALVIRLVWAVLERLLLPG